MTRLMVPLLGTSEYINSPEELIDALKSNQPQRVQTVNLHHYVLARRDAQFAEVLRDADIKTADGWPIQWLLRCAGHRVSRVTGSQFTEEVVNGNTRFTRLALIGASEQVGSMFVAQAARSGIEVVMRDHSVATQWDSDTLARRARAADADLTLVAATPPIGDMLAESLLQSGLTCSVVSVGGSIDMVVGIKPRAPALLQTARVEWLYRWFLEPRRMAVRYLQCSIAMISVVLPLGVKLLLRRHLTQPWRRP